MTAQVVPWDRDRCPKCLQVESVELDAPQRLCLNCRHEWDADVTTGPLPGVASVEPVPTPPIETYVGPMDVTDELAERMAVARTRYVGRQVTYFDVPAVGECVAISDEGVATIEFGSGFQVEAWPDEFDLAPEPGMDDATVRALGAVDLQIAAMVAQAAVATIVVEGDQRKLGLPPDGYLPNDADILAVVEHGAAYAVAALALVAGVAQWDLEQFASQLAEAATAAEEATGR